MPSPDPKSITIDDFVTATKLSGSAGQLMGWTKPEGWPFVIVCAVASPGNERALEYAQEFAVKMAKAGASVLRADFEDWP